MEIQSDNLLLEVLKWVGIVLAAGFVGYFGRYLAMVIIERTHRKKSETQATPSEPGRETQPQGGDERLEREKQRAKVEKKLGKAEAKRAKKESKK